MKKSLVLAMAMALGVTASAYAANPFSDVPAGHWAYDNISKLAAAGVIEGYGDDTFRGDRLMTRYEMAQIVAKAMAKGANVDRLASEFADELDALGVRVAALEKKADNVKITGQVRYHYAHTDAETKANSSANKLRSRLFFTGMVNDNWNYVGMLQNEQDFTNNTGDEGTDFQRAFLNGRLGGMKVTAGRYNENLADGNIYDTRFDGVKVAYGDKVKVGAYFGRPTNSKNIEGTKYREAWGANLKAGLGEKVDLVAGYDKFRDAETGAKDDNGIWNAGLVGNFGDFMLSGIYLHSDLDTVKTEDNDGFVITAKYGNAKASKPGSWALQAKYYDQGAGTFVAHTMNGDYASFMDEGFKGYQAAGYYTVAKNMVAGVEYYELKGKETDLKNKTLWGQMIVTF